MTYTFKNTLANSEVQVSESETRFMVDIAFGDFYGWKQLQKLNNGEIDYIPVQNGRITKGVRVR